MIQPQRLSDDLRGMLRKLETDLRERCKERPEVNQVVRDEHAAARAAGRTSQAFEVWRDDYLTQVAVAWILGCVFVRFLEDNRLVPTARLSGPGESLQAARDRHTAFFRAHPTLSDREYLESVFRDLLELPGVKGLFDEAHNPLWKVGISGDGATALLGFWQRLDPATGALVHDFTDPERDTRFLGDLYQDLSETAKKHYALLQTPKFVEDFILDRTLTPAMATFGPAEVRVIDPTCGSGHFLLGAFHRIFDRLRRDDAVTNVRVLVQRALDSVAGVDLNPFAVAIARFRLLVAALAAAEIDNLRDAPNFQFTLAAGDSLLHGPRPGRDSGARQMFLLGDEDPLGHVYAAEDAPALRRILGRQYHVVVGNPPYITPKDAAMNQAYRERFKSCHMKYSLAVPFLERFFDLAIRHDNTGQGALFPDAVTEREPDPQADLFAVRPSRPTEPGFVGMITANSFMKREFGKKVIEQFMPSWDITHVIDTSGAYIPGHGTPTVILVGRNRKPVASTVRAVLGIKGEPSTPDDPARGKVWSAILNQVDVAGSQSEFVSVADMPRANFHKHPWSIGGGGAAELKELIEENAICNLDKLIDSIGFMSISGEDEAFVAPRRVWERGKSPFRIFGIGDCVRDWSISSENHIIFMYDEESLEVQPLESLGFFETIAWMTRSNLKTRLMFGKYPEESGLVWYEYRYFAKERYRIPLTITFGEIATHNHFVLDRGGKVFKQTAPVIKLPKTATEDDHLKLLGLLNSSTACFWIKQVCFNKGSTVDQHGARQRTMPFEDFYAHDGTKLKQFPVPGEKPLAFTRKLDELALEFQQRLPANLATRAVPERDAWKTAETDAHAIRARMIALQEELDWQCYELYGLLDETAHVPDADAVPPINLGERAFEIVMARRMAAGELTTTWFERHGSTPTTEMPAGWPEPYRKLVERRIKLIESDPNVRLIEKPEYKRRWNTEPWDDQASRALRGWLLDRLEDARYWRELRPASCRELADRVRADEEFMRVAEMCVGRPDFDPARLVTELVESEAVPLLPEFRYRETGLRNRRIWERVWELQRLEDEIDARTTLPEGDPQRLTEEQAKALKAGKVGDIEVPPKYKSSDFQSATYWRLRGKLDVPKERFVSFPKCERGQDRTPVIAWAGWDAAQLAQAIASFYVAVRTEDGWPPARLLIVLKALAELLPTLKHRHNAFDPTYGLGLGDFFESFVHDEARALGKTPDEL